MLGDNYQRGEKYPTIIVHFSFIYFEVIIEVHIHLELYLLENFKFCCLRWSSLSYDALCL